MLLISKTYEIITPESAEDGEVAESGFLWEDTECTVREMADTLRGLQPSQWPITNPEWCWFTSYGEADYLTGEVENESYHYSKNNPAKNLKYWRSAIIAAGFEIK